MATTASQAPTPVDALNRAFLLNYPRDAARKIETMPAGQAADLLRDQPTYVLLPVWSKLSPGVVDSLLLQLPDDTIANLLTALAANLLSNWMRIAMDPKLNWRLERVTTDPAPTEAKAR